MLSYKDIFTGISESPNNKKGTNRHHIIVYLFEQTYFRRGTVLVLWDAMYVAFVFISKVTQRIIPVTF